MGNLAKAPAIGGEREEAGWPAWMYGILRLFLSEFSLENTALGKRPGLAGHHAGILRGFDDA
jgi:hypothetical protein